MIRSGQAKGALAEVSAGGVVFRHLDDAVHVLLIRDAYGHWGLPKGHLEAGESSEEAAVREVREETGLDGLRLGPALRTIDWHFRSKRGVIHKTCHFFLIESPTGEPIPQTDEGITECIWLPMEDAIRRISYRNTAEVLEEAAAELGVESSGAG